MPTTETPTGQNAFPQAFSSNLAHSDERKFHATCATVSPDHALPWPGAAPCEKAFFAAILALVMVLLVNSWPMLFLYLYTCELYF